MTVAPDVTAESEADPIAEHLDTLAVLGHNGWLASAQVKVLLAGEAVTASVLLKDQVETPDGAARYEVRLGLLTPTRVLLWTGLELPQQGPAAEEALANGRPVPTYTRAHIRAVPLRALIDVRVHMLTHDPEQWAPPGTPADWVLVDLITAEQGNVSFRATLDETGAAYGDAVIEHDGLQMLTDSDTDEMAVPALLKFATAVSTALATP